LLGAVLLLLAFAAGLLVWQFNFGTPKTAPRRAFVNGILNYSPAVRAKIDRLNNSLDSCLLRNGATRIVAGRGWTYNDPRGAAGKACSGEQNAVNTYANSAEMRQANQELAPALRAYSACMQKHGIANAYHVGVPTPTAAVLNAANIACGGPTSTPTTAGG
jgi:hypothetical protein